MGALMAALSALWRAIFNNTKQMGSVLAAALKGAGGRVGGDGAEDKWGH